MPNWKKAVKQFFANSDPNGEFFHCAPDGAAETTINTIAKKLKTELPSELREFYGQFNGIGLTNDESECPNFIPPIEYLPKFIKTARLAFPKSHKQYAARYLPVVDWENGDTSGYLLDEDGAFIDCLVMFNHELCTGEKTQDINDFLSPVADSLYGFLNV